jgi:DNA-binding transcriptional MerR regulator
MYTRELIQKTQITRDALRHYNDIKLLNPKTNPKNNYKIYSDGDVELILFVKKAQKIGFSLNEIKKIAAQMRSATCKHQSLIPYLEEQLDDISEKIITLQKMKKHIRSLITDFEKRNCEVHPTDLQM